MMNNLANLVELKAEMTAKRRQILKEAKACQFPDLKKQMMDNALKISKMLADVDWMEAAYMSQYAATATLQ